MRTRTLGSVIALSLLAAAPASRAHDTGKHEKHAAKGAAKAAVFVSPDEAQWSDAPPVLPKGAQMTVLHGDPSSKGAFAVRLKMPEGYKIPPHWHTQDEQLTILSGQLSFHTGDTMDSPAHDLAAGAYHFLPGKTHHSAEARSETIVQLNGMGPFDIHYLNPADNPQKSAAATR